jgi:hypothetical protein
MGGGRQKIKQKSSCYKLSVQPILFSLGIFFFGQHIDAASRNRALIYQIYRIVTSPPNPFWLRQLYQMMSLPSLMQHLATLLLSPRPKHNPRSQTARARAISWGQWESRISLPLSLSSFFANSFAPPRPSLSSYQCLYALRLEIR